MTLIYLGLALFLGTHLFSAYAPSARAAVVGKIGEGPFKGLYSLASLGGFVLLVLGWRSTVPEIIYTPPAWGLYAAYALMTVSFILFATSYLPAGRIKSLAGHPMVLGTAVAGLAHLLVNGDSRSVTVFGAFLVYGVVARVSYHLRGDKGASGTSLLGDGAAVLGGLFGGFLVVHHLHHYLSGVRLAPWLLFG
ncbi:MAG: NnrU family protein [Pseudomonadota bacterium]